MTDNKFDRRGMLGLTTLGLGLAAGGAAIGATALATRPALAQAAGDSTLFKVIDRGHIVVGTGSTNAPWHFEDGQGNLTGMDIAMARVLAKALFDDPEKVEFIKQDPAARIPNVVSGKIDIAIQFMTISGARAEVVGFSRPYYVEGVALLVSPESRYQTHAELLAAGGDARASVLQNIDAELLVSDALPEAQAMLIDTQANVIQAMKSGRSDAAVVDLSTVRWMASQSPNEFIDAGFSFRSQLYGAAMLIEDHTWRNYVNTAFNIQMHGHDTELYDTALLDFFGIEAPERKPGFPRI